MKRILIAIRAFFAALFSGQTAERLDAALRQTETDTPAETSDTKPRKPPAPEKRPTRSEAVTLLATLQREARFIDFIQEPLADYTDAQVGAVVRDVHRDCGKVLERLFAVRPTLDESEQAEVEVLAGFDAGRYRLTGNVTGEPPFRGSLAHHGWEASKCDIPAWSGTDESAKVVAPAEVELS